MGADAEGIGQRLQRIAEQGIPNYFGEQRFGRQGNNLLVAAKWFEEGISPPQRGPRGIITSAARSHLFNLVLAARVERGTWLRCLPGDLGTEPSGPLWGRGRPLVTAETLALEDACLEPFAAWRNGLEHSGLQQERRELIARPQDLRWVIEADQLKLEFALLPGQFATALLREICQLQNCAGPNDR